MILCESEGGGEIENELHEIESEDDGEIESELHESESEDDGEKGQLRVERVISANKIERAFHLDKAPASKPRK